MSPLLNMVLCPIGGLTPSTSYRGRIVSKKIPLRETSHKLKQYLLKKKGTVIFTKHKTRSIQTATTAPPAGKGWSLMLFKKLIVTFYLLFLAVERTLLQFPWGQIHKWVARLNSGRERGPLLVPAVRQSKRPLKSKLPGFYLAWPASTRV